MVVVDDRVIVQGRWYGIVGRRFVRPALRIGGQRRVIATLEHKPWAPLEGELWTAAFPHSGSPPASAELEVAPDLTVDLETGKQPQRKGKPAARVAVEKARIVETKKAGERESLLAAQREREDLRSRLEHSITLRKEAFEERDEALAARDAALSEAADRERLAREQARAEVDRVTAEFATARKEYDDTYIRAVRAEQALAAAKADLAALRQELADDPRPTAPPEPTVVYSPPSEHHPRTPSPSRRRFDPDADDDAGRRIAAAALIIVLIVAFVLILGLIF
jgi:hypothetical protein